jgi:hypothetical protein
MMNDMRRIATEPTEEDREWFSGYAGCGDWMGTLRQAWAEYRDESFVLQFLSPKLIRDFRLFAVDDDAKESAMDVSAIHNEQGYRDVRRRLARHYDVATQDPDLQITDADRAYWAFQPVRKPVDQPRAGQRFQRVAGGDAERLGRQQWNGGPNRLRCGEVDEQRAQKNPGPEAVAPDQEGGQRNPGISSSVCVYEPSTTVCRF